MLPIICHLVNAIKTTVGYHYTLAWLKFITLASNDRKGVEHQVFSLIVDGNANWYSCFGKQCGSLFFFFFYKTNHTLSILAITFLGIYAKKLKVYVHRKTCIWMFIIAFFINVKTWEQLICPSVGEKQVNCGTSRQ